MVWTYNGEKIIGVEADSTKNEYELTTESGKVIVVPELIYENGTLITHYESVGLILGDKPGEPKGIRWNEGRCYSCNAEVDPYATGCYKCHRSFVD